MDNPYLDVCRSGVGRTLPEWATLGLLNPLSIPSFFPGRGDNSFHILSSERHDLCLKYAWAIPNEKAIQTLVAHSPILDIPAGTGYWASLVEKEGGKVVCIDRSPPVKQWTKVEEGDESCVQNYPDHTLFLCWPPYATPMAANCLKNYTGSRIIYVGEGHGGCTADDEFHDLLEEQFQEIEVVNIPQYSGIHDRLYVYERK